MQRKWGACRRAQSAAARGQKQSVLRTWPRRIRHQLRGAYSAGRSLSGKAVTYGDSRWSRPSCEIRYGWVDTRRNPGCRLDPKDRYVRAEPRLGRLRAVDGACVRERCRHLGGLAGGLTLRGRRRRRGCPGGWRGLSSADAGRCLGGSRRGQSACPGRRVRRGAHRGGSALVRAAGRGLQSAHAVDATAITAAVCDSLGT